jgi:hypothetical protein
VQQTEDLVDERLRFARLLHDEVPATLLRDLDECVARHVLHTLVRLMHELKQLVNDRLEKLPVRLEEAGILANDVHDVRCDDGLVVFAALHLAKAEEIFDNRHEEAFLGLLA